MTEITIIVVVVLTAIAFTSGQVQKHGQNIPTFMTRFDTRSVKERLSVQPPPMPGFNLKAYLGQWFYQFHKAPCNWAIAEEFTDYSQIFVPVGNIFMNYESMRNRDLCNTMNSVFSVTGPGQFSGKDLIGDNWSGKIKIVATDYNGFAINWGCTRWSTFDQTCADPWLYVKTRQVKLSKGVLGRIESALQNIFGISLNELSRIPHGRPCPKGKGQL
ncbi:uncharacterized protein LOC132722049 [Ruditapes philippinarum]|uniref:uncharacterized protein LOC132722049 n=1 Tax=Ruditapes philippinarum TaxID=129788 RepID=UPI00295B71C1|nr:uncharacterized protein LOC132722049 [Ruditapes philippinarum]